MSQYYRLGKGLLISYHLTDPKSRDSVKANNPAACDGVVHYSIKMKWNHNICEDYGNT